VIGIYSKQSLQVIETFLFVRLGEGDVCWNVAGELQKCCEGVDLFCIHLHTNLWYHLCL